MFGFIIVITGIIIYTITLIDGIRNCNHNEIVQSFFGYIIVISIAVDSYWKW